jgi:hypothetical protein
MQPVLLPFKRVKEITEIGGKTRTYGDLIKQKQLFNRLYLASAIK